MANRRQNDSASCLFRIAQHWCNRLCRILGLRPVLVRYSSAIAYAAWDGQAVLLNPGAMLMLMSRHGDEGLAHRLSVLVGVLGHELGHRLYSDHRLPPGHGIELRADDVGGALLGWLGLPTDAFETALWDISPGTQTHPAGFIRMKAARAGYARNVDLRRAG